MILIPASIGELIDKLSILKIKKEKVTDVQKLIHINKEYDALFLLSSPYLETNEVYDLFEELVEINSKLWDVEDRIREFEFIKCFNEEFIDLARQVYITNDERFVRKDKINKLSNSEIKEIKNYKEYK